MEKKIDIVRAWKDPDYRASLADSELPAHPAGVVEVRDEQLAEASGGKIITTAITCTEFTFGGLRCCCP